MAYFIARQGLGGVGLFGSVLIPPPIEGAGCEWGAEVDDLAMWVWFKGQLK